MDTVRLLAFAVTGALVAAALRRIKPEFSLAAGLLAAFAALTAALAALSPALTLFRSLADAIPNGTEYLTALMKAAGAAILSSLASDVCLDCEERALSKTCLLIGRLSVLLASLPIFLNLDEAALSAMNTFG